jgi:hypothetical protein
MYYLIYLLTMIFIYMHCKNNVLLLNIYYTYCKMEVHQSSVTDTADVVDLGTLINNQEHIVQIYM